MEVWRDISLIWLILLTVISILPFAILFFFAIRGLTALRRVVKQFMPKAQERARMVTSTVDRISGKVAKPFIDTHAMGAQVRGMTQEINRRR